MVYLKTIGCFSIYFLARCDGLGRCMERHVSRRLRGLRNGSWAQGALLHAERSTFLMVPLRDLCLRDPLQLADSVEKAVKSSVASWVLSVEVLQQTICMMCKQRKMKRCSVAEGIWLIFCGMAMSLALTETRSWARLVGSVETPESHRSQASSMVWHF